MVDQESQEKLLLRMPPSLGHTSPRTPNRRASASHILNAFFSLTAKNSLIPHPQEAVLPPTLTHDQNGIDTSAANTRAFSENGSASTASQAASEDMAPVPTVPSPPVLGGPPELARLLAQLAQTRPLTERINAALKLRAILDQYSITSLLTVWSLGEDLLANSSDEASKAGMALLLGCASANNLGASGRHVFYDSLVTASRQDRHITLQVQVLQALTNGGRIIESFEQNVLSHAASMLKLFYDTISKERREQRSNGVGPESTLRDIFTLVSAIIKFNARILDDKELDAVVQTIYDICQATTASQDVENSIQVMVTLLTFTQLPSSSLNRCLELIADIFRQMQMLKDLSWDVAATIFTSHLGHAAMETYLNILRSGGVGVKRMVCRGSFRLLAQLSEMHGKHGLPILSFGHFLAATDQGLRGRDSLLAHDVLIYIEGLLVRDDLRILLQDEPEWDTFVRCIKKSADILNLTSFVGPEYEVDQNGVNAHNHSISRSTHSDYSSSKKGESDAKAVDLIAAGRDLHKIVLALTSILTDVNIVHRDAVISFLLSLGSRLSNVAAEVLVTCCVEERLLLPTSANWIETCKTLIVSFVHDVERPNHLRSLSISVLRQAWDTIEMVSPETASELAQLILKHMASETDGLVLDALASFAAKVVNRADSNLFEAILTIFRVTVFDRKKQASVAANTSPLRDFPIGIPAQTEPSLCRTAAKHIIRMFITNVNKSARKAKALYSFTLKVATSSECAVDARICAMKLLFRLRATSSHAIYIRSLPESERVAAVLSRTVKTAQWLHPSEPATGLDLRTSSYGTGASMNGKQSVLDVRKSTPPLWFYPGPEGLPEEPSPESSIFVFSFQDPAIEPTREDTTVLPVELWLETIIGLLQQQDVNWEIYSYLVVHLGAQLTNQNLFRGCIRQVQLLRSILCDQVRAASFHEPPGYTSLKKADVAVCLFQILTMLIGYHDHFARGEEDELVRTFILGIGSWDRTSKWCIHALSVCCHELPLSVSKMLDSVIQKMAQIITQTQVAVHILEFLVMLARLPELYKNFREDEYKMVFGVSFRYLQYVRGKQERVLNRDRVTAQTRMTKAQVRQSDSFRELCILNDDSHTRGRAVNEDLPQYVYALAFHVITFWFMNLRLDDRPMYMPWISRNLTYQDIEGKDIMEDQGLVTIDMMDKVAFTDRDETAYDPKFAKETDGEVMQRTWVVGLSLVTIETAGRTGVSQITRRRPSGTKYSIFRPALTSPPRHQVPLTTGLAADAFYTSSYTGVLPEDVIQDFYSSFGLLDVRLPRPIQLPDDDAVSRAVSSFDRNSTVDGHKVGVIYIGEGQDAEADILQNTHGSADYTSFVDKLGFLTRLKGAKFNVQGLDRSEDTDGKYVYCWRDRATEIVFHVTTMMPTDVEHDPQCVKKKSHIGNDFVNIVWNGSSKDFKFETFPSAFNYIYIVITPEAISPFTTLREKERAPDCFYQVQVMSAPGFPEISPAAETKLLSAKALPDFVRLLALNASVFSLVWQNREGGEHFSPWRNRLREIKRLREKYTGSDGHALRSTFGSACGSKVVPPSTIQKTQIESLTTGGVLISPPMVRERGGRALSQQPSRATFSGSEDLSRSSLTTSSADEKTSVHRVLRSHD